jgi:hypothetical protein
VIEVAAEEVGARGVNEALEVEAVGAELEGAKADPIAGGFLTGTEGTT